MVETAVRKNREPQTRNQNIRLTGQSPNILIDSPTTAENATHACVESSFRHGPATLDARHNLAAFCCRENVGHRTTNVPET